MGTSLITKTIVLIFTLICLAVFFGFIARHPLDWQQPETLRLHYYGLQSQLKSGPLNATLSLNDFRKPLVWEAQGGMFDGRYPIMLLDGLVPKLYQFFYSHVGPFLSEPVNIFLILLTSIMLCVLVYEQAGSWSAALLAGGVWLVTSQTLLDACYPIRPNMALLTFLLAYLLWEVLRLRRLERSGGALARIGLALTFSIFCHEFALNFVPIIILITLLEGKSLRKRFVPVAATCAAAVVVYLIALFVILPPLADLVTGKRPTMDWMMGGLQPLLQDPSLLIARFHDYGMTGIGEMARQNLGCGVFLPGLLQVLGLVASLIFLVTMRVPAWKKAIKPLLVAIMYFFATAILMFPVIPASVEMPVYYYSTIILLFMIPVGALLSGLRVRGDEWRWGIAGCALLTVGLLNLRQSDEVMKRMPGDFGYNPVMRKYVRDILNIPGGEKLPGSVYTAYPRPKNFDISRRWDIMLRVWHGESEQVFSLMMPVLHLRLYEKQILLGSAEEFEVIAQLDPQEYENRAKIYWDMPEQKLFNLEYLRSLISDSGIIPEGRWSAEGAAPGSQAGVAATLARGLPGMTPRAILPAGSWSLKIPPPPSTVKDPLALLLMVKADLMPPGPDDVMNRTEPIPFRDCKLFVRERETGATIYSGSQNYGWSYQLFPILLSLPAPQGWDVSLESTAETEVVGPILINARALRSPAWVKTYSGDPCFK